MALKDLKNWSPEVEKKITGKWKKAEMYNFNKNTKKKIYSIDTPPPYINSPIHMGHAVTYSFMDMIARHRRMKGFEVLFPLGMDRNGLPIEMGAEKKYGISAFKVGRKKFIEYCERLLNETSAESVDSFARLGISFSSYREGKEIGKVYNTDSPEYRALTQATFIDLYKKGLIYEDARVSNWDPKLQTTIADSEIEYVDLASTFNDIKWKVKETGETIIIGTTRPELICTCGMVIFNPKDSRYRHLDGKTAITPIFGKEVLIRAHPLADPEKGTGIAMMCSAGDLSDIQFFREMRLEPVIAINIDGKMNEHAGFLKGLKVRDAREKIVGELKKKKLLVKQEKITHRTPISERSKAEIEFIAMPELYLKQLDFISDVKKIANKVNFYPKASKKILDDWINSVSIDWPISRRRFYATEIPLWYAEDSGEDGKNSVGKLIALPQPGKYYRPWKESVFDVAPDAIVMQNGCVLGKVGDSNFKNLKWKGEERVFDTWMDSSISELNIIKYKADNAFFKKAYPVTLRPQGKEIVRTWLYYTLLRGFLETGKPCFKDAWIHQHILDEKGRKMSKSLGNVLDPHEILKEFGGEAMRLWSAIEGDLSKGDFSASKEKIRAELKTLSKMLNVSRFVMLFNKPKAKPKKITDLDKLFIDYIEDFTEEADKAYERYDFNHPAQKLRFFLWETFASHYLEMVKARAYNQNKAFSKADSDSAKYTLYFLLERFLHLIYPIIPQVSTTIADELGIDLLRAEWPKAAKGKSGKPDLALVDKIMDFNKMVWKQKKDSGLSLRAEIAGVVIPKELKKFEKDLIATHKII